MTKHTLKEWMIAVRPWSIPASAMPIIVTIAFLFWKEADIKWGFAIWALVGMILFHLAGNVWSDWFDFKKKVDAEDTFGAKTLTTGMFEPEEIKKLAIILLAAASICGIGLALAVGVELFYIGIAGAVLTVLYPFLKYNALGDLDILLTFAFLPTLGTAFVATGVIDWSVLLVAVPVGLITDGILHSNNTRDMETDKRAEIHTMAMGLGKKLSALLYGFEMLFPFAWVAVLSILGYMPCGTVAVFLTLPVAIGCAKTMKNATEGGSALIGDLDVRTANLQLMFSVLLTLSFVISRLLSVYFC